MNKINWKIRLKNKSFWMTLVPALLLTAQRFADLLGYQFTLDEKQGDILMLINSIFIVLAVVGIVSDPTVKGFSDSELAMSYAAPHNGLLDTAEITAEDTVDEALGK